MDFTVTISEKFGVLPFEILKQDKDRVIMLINYYIEKGDESPQSKTKEIKKNGQTKNRVRVNDRTASGGWY